MREIAQSMDHWPENQRKAVQERLKKINVEYDDNYRYARRHLLEECSSFDRIKEKGCCGSYEDIIEVNGVSIIFGFNYGH